MHHRRDNAKEAIDLADLDPEAGLTFTSVTDEDGDPDRVVAAVHASLEEISLVEEHTEQEDSDRSTIPEDDYVIKYVWSVERVHTVRIRGNDLHWCVTLEDTTVSTEWFQNTVVLGSALSKYASYSKPHPVTDSIFVTWHRQWVRSDRVPHPQRSDFLKRFERERNL